MTVEPIDTNAEIKPAENAPHVKLTWNKMLVNNQPVFFDLTDGTVNFADRALTFTQWKAFSEHVNRLYVRRGDIPRPSDIVDTKAEEGGSYRRAGFFGRLFGYKAHIMKERI